MPVFIHSVLSCGQSLQFVKSMNIHCTAQCSGILLQLEIEDDMLIINQIPQPANIIFRTATMDKIGAVRLRWKSGTSPYIYLGQRSRQHNKDGARETEW